MLNISLHHTCLIPSSFLAEECYFKELWALPLVQIGVNYTIHQLGYCIMDETSQEKFGIIVSQVVKP